LKRSKCKNPVVSDFVLRRIPSVKMRNIRHKSNVVVRRCRTGVIVNSEVKISAKRMKSEKDLFVDLET